MSRKQHNSRISRYINLKITFSIVCVRHLDVHIKKFSIYTKLSQIQSIWKISSLYCCIRLASHLFYFYRFYHQRATYTWSVCNDIYDNVLRYEYLFQTKINWHKKYIFDTNNIQSEYAFLFPLFISTHNVYK